MNRVLLRDFIFDRLYHPTQGYFCRSDFQIGQMKQPIDFKLMIGYDDYQKALVKSYPDNAWLTPSEIFKPYYGMTVANYISKAHIRYEQKERKKKDIRIVEVGAGLGSAAESILNYFKLYESRTYETMSYTAVEISPTLCKRMKDKLLPANQRMADSGRLRIINEDILNFKDETQQLTYVLLFEVLDNLPHDQVIVDPESHIYRLETRVDLETKKEEHATISDRLIMECLNHYLKLPTTLSPQPKLDIFSRIANYYVKKYINKKENKDVLFLPTYCLKMLKRLKYNIPNAHLVISDFDSLPSQISGVNAPIVSHKGKQSHEKIDYGTYLVDRGSADIFFPTNFDLLRLMYQAQTGKKSQHLKTFEFVSEFSRENWASTQSGYNPFKEDFLNTSFFLTTV